MEVISVDDLETTEAGEDDAVWEHIRENVQGYGRDQVVKLASALLGELTRQLRQEAREATPA